MTIQIYPDSLLIIKPANNQHWVIVNASGKCELFENEDGDTLVKGKKNELFSMLFELSKTYDITII